MLEHWRLAPVDCRIVNSYVVWLIDIVYRTSRCVTAHLVLHKHMSLSVIKVIEVETVSASGALFLKVLFHTVSDTIVTADFAHHCKFCIKTQCGRLPDAHCYV